MPRNGGAIWNPNRVSFPSHCRRSGSRETSEASCPPGSLTTSATASDDYLATVFTSRRLPAFERQRELGTAPHARAIDEGHGRKREIAETVEELVPSLKRSLELLGREVDQGPQLSQVGPGDVLPRLTAPKKKPREVGPFFELRDKLPQLFEDGTRQRIDLLIRGVERQHGNWTGKFFESENICHDGFQ